MTGLPEPGFDRLWTATREAWQRRGPSGDARIRLSDLTVQEVHAIDGLLWTGRRLVVGGKLSCSLSSLEAALLERGEQLLAVLAAHDGPVADVRAERRAARAAHVDLIDSLSQQIDVFDKPVLHDWLAAARLRPDDELRASVAVTVVGQLPVDPRVSRSVFAARVCAGDSHALDPGTALERIVRKMLQWVDGCPDAELGTLAARRLWERFGVEPDPTSSTVLTLGLPGEPGSACGRILAASQGCHAVLSYGLLGDEPPQWSEGLEVFVCENPSVVHTAERRLGARCAPLVCTAGWPGSAVQLLLTSLRDAGARLHHHADFDIDGLAMHEHVAAAYGAGPWRFDAGAYRAAVDTLPDQLPPLAPTNAPGALGDAFRELRVQVVEELVLEELLIDLEAV